ncbi:hypothetical protein [Sporolactobacillus vineae]|uniref:hypothetical protein n=1 Tax=Sporolactobacillus vineae TaxID=444463 RepID=UPI000288DDDE|nr:hypothetical protein [Sporolactobacillus vineae]
MSFVSIIASTQRVSAVSDGTLVEVNGEGHITALPGAKPSLIRISDTQLVACTGSASVLRRLKERFPYKKEPYVIDKEIRDELKQEACSVPFSQQDVLIAVAEVTAGVVCRIISNQPGAAWQTLVPSPNRLAALYLAGRAVNEEEIKEIAAEADRQLQLFGKETPEQILNVQKSLNRFVAGKDAAVGQRIFKMVMEK